MAITRWKGSASSKEPGTLTLDNVEVNSGSTLIVGRCYYPGEDLGPIHCGDREMKLVRQETNEGLVFEMWKLRMREDATLLIAAPGTAMTAWSFETLECNECFGTGLRGGFHARCSRGCPLA